MPSKPTVFIHTNDKQIFGAFIAASAMKRASKHPNEFDVKLLRLEDTPHLLKREGQRYLRKGKQAMWRNDDLQSFSPLRKMVPQLMGYEGRAVVVDPDIFAVGDIYELLTLDMKGKAIMCRHVVDGYKGNGNRFYASSVMLLDCAKLRHWKWDDEIDAMFASQLDYGPWISLLNEASDTIGEIGEEWNSLDKLTPETRLLHTTERSTQPWRTGLPVDFDTTTKATTTIKCPSGLLGRILSVFRPRPQIAKSAEIQRYKPHPDSNQERLIMEMIKGALEAGDVTEIMVKEHMAKSNIRPDIFECLAHIGYQDRNGTKAA